MARASDYPVLVADIGGTNARFALVRADGGEPDLCHTLANDDHASLADAIAAYLDLTGGEHPRRACLAVAGPQKDGNFRLTNRRSWDVNVSALSARFGFANVELLNDFGALALGLHRLGADGLDHLGATQLGEAGTPMAVVGPGTGLGVGAAIPVRGGWQAIPGEGGHVELAHPEDRPAAALDIIRRRFGRVSGERVLCGPGMGLLHSVLGEVDGVSRAPRDAAAITAGAEAGDAECRDTLAVFLSLTASLAGDLGLIYGARNGVFIGGGIIARVRHIMDRAAFVKTFLNKGRLAEFLAPVPLAIIIHDRPALLGCAAHLEQTAGAQP